MNWGKIATIALVLASVGAGAGVWYAQEYGFYDRIEDGSPESVVLIQTSDGSGWT